MPYGYPSGDGLVSRILDTSSDQDHRDLNLALNIPTPLLQEFRLKLTKSKAASIDEFLGGTPDTRYQEIGKKLIARALTECESESRLFKRDNDDDWYSLLLRAIAPSAEHVAQNNLTFVTFNYDRSLEHFLFTALQNRYDWAPEQVAEALSGINIIHVHGCLSRLSWQEGGINEFPYTPEVTADRIRLAAQGIQIIHEASGSTPTFVKAANAISSAKYVFFLGFGYHRLNIERLGFNKFKEGEKAVMGSSYGMTSHEIVRLRQKYPALYFGEEHMEHHKTCATLRRSPGWLHASDE